MIRTRPALCVSIAATALLSPSCIVVATVVAVPMKIVDALTQTDAPTLDAPESPGLAQRVTGTLIVADRSGTLTLVSLPTRAVHRVRVGGSVIAASGPDEGGRIVYVRDALGPLEILFGVMDGRRNLMERRPLDGPERKILELYRGFPAAGASLRIARREGRAAYGDIDHPIEIIDLDRASRFDAGAPFRDARAYEFADGPSPAIVAPNGPDPRTCELLGSVGGPFLPAGDGLLIYAGLARPDAKPKDHPFGGGLLWPTFDHAIRLGDPRTGETLTLVERFTSGTYDFTPVALPLPRSSAAATGVRLEPQHPGQ